MPGNAMFGNCFLGAIWLMVSLRSLRIKTAWLGRWIPHFYVVAKDGSFRHFRLVRDVLPFPFYFLCFYGSFVRTIEPLK